MIQISSIRNKHHHHNYYYFYCTLISCSFTLLTLIPNQVQANLAQTIKNLKIPTDILPVSSSLQVAKAQANGVDINPGNPVPAKNLRYLDKNKVHWDVDDDARYTVIVLDLDRKTTATAGYNNTNVSLYNQYTSINIQGNSLINGQDIVQYEPPSVPCNPSTKHRLVMLVYHQAETIDLLKAAAYAASIGDTAKRENFKLGEFSSYFSLTPVATNIFTAHGESGGVCSGSIPLKLPASFVLVLMVILALGTTIKTGASPSYYLR